MKKSLGLVVFRGEEDVPKFKDEYGFEIKSNKYLKKDGKDINCHCCEKPLKTSNLGSILPGSRLFYCDDPTCLAEYVSEHIEE